MNVQNSKISQSGFSLIELMIAMVLGLILIGGVVQVFVSNVQTFKLNNGVGRVQENARFAIAELSRNLRGVGYKGCMAKEISVTNQAGATYSLDNASPDLYTYKVPPSGSFSAGGSTITGAIENTHAITLKTLEDGVKLTAATTTTTLTVNDASAYAAGDVLFIGDCEKNDIVDVASVSGNVITLADTLAIPYGAEALVHKLEVATYYIAPTSQPGLTANSLYKKVNASAAQELVIGIENMKFLFGVDSGSDNVPNQFLESGDASLNAEDVLVVRLLLNATSIESMGTDGIAERDFSVSISLRNRLAVGAG